MLEKIKKFFAQEEKTGHSAIEDGWRRYARRMVKYSGELRRAGLPADHPERVRVRECLKTAFRMLGAE